MEKDTKANQGAQKRAPRRDLRLPPLSARRAKRNFDAAEREGLRRMREEKE